MTRLLKILLAIGLCPIGLRAQQGPQDLHPYFSFSGGSNSAPQTSPIITPALPPDAQNVSDDGKFDQLIRDYLDKYKANNQFSNIVTFNTRLGDINFTKENIRFGFLSYGKPAWIRIGKHNSLEAEENIKAWLEESRNAKKQLGYILVSDKTIPCQYGDAEIAIMRRNDDYFITRVQRSRNEGTYDRWYYTYDYYVEIGKSSRRKAYEAEQAVKKLGN